MESISTYLSDKNALIRTLHFHTSGNTFHKIFTLIFILAFCLCTRQFQRHRFQRATAPIQPPMLTLASFSSTLYLTLFQSDISLSHAQHIQTFWKLSNQYVTYIFWHTHFSPYTELHYRKNRKKIRLDIMLILDMLGESRRPNSMLHKKLCSVNMEPLYLWPGSLSIYGHNLRLQL